MKKFVDILFLLWTMFEFGMIGFVLSRFDIKVAAITTVIGLAYYLIYIKQTEFENQLFEIKKIIKNGKV